MDKHTHISMYICEHTHTHTDIAFWVHTRIRVIRQNILYKKCITWNMYTQNIHTGSLLWGAFPCTYNKYLTLEMTDPPPPPPPTKKREKQHVKQDNKKKKTEEEENTLHAAPASEENQDLDSDSPPPQSGHSHWERFCDSGSDTWCHPQWCLHNPAWSIHPGSHQMGGHFPRTFCTLKQAIFIQTVRQVRQNKSLCI